jgi:hypothetical protein
MHGVSTSEDREAAIIDKLSRAGCSFTYINHLRQVLAGELQEPDSFRRPCVGKKIYDVNFLQSMVAEDRNHILQNTILRCGSSILHRFPFSALIVRRRIMKTRKALKGQVLIQEVSSQICQYGTFAPFLPDIMKVPPTCSEHH